MDSQSLIVVLTIVTRNTERRRTIDPQTVKNAENVFEISEAALITSEFNIADGLTKPKENSLLMDTIPYGKIEHPIE